MASIAVSSPAESTQNRIEPKKCATIHSPFAPWKPWQQVLFRVSLLFITQITLPFRAQFYRRLIGIRGLHDIYGVAMIGQGVNYVTLKSDSGRWGLASFVNWGIALLVAAALSAVWTWFARNSTRKEYTVAYYWLRLWTRYWVALNILHYAYIKVYPVQMPFPSIANLHTLVGDIAPYRYYWAVIGLSTWYQIALGCCEALAGTLLLFRRTTAIGAILGLGVLYNVAHANFAYDGGVHLLSAEIALLASFLLVQYIPDIYRLLVKKEDVTPNYYFPKFKAAWARNSFTALKYSLWILFIPLYAYSNNHHYLYTNQSKEPRAPGLKGSKGYYSVTDFKLNGRDLPYSPLDPVRWQNVTFEDYPTLTFQVNKALPVRLENGGQGIRDAEKTYELAGYAGGRTFLHYDLNETQQTLAVQDKNNGAIPRDAGSAVTDFGGSARRKTATGSAANANGRRGRSQGDGPQKLVWHYSRPTQDRIILTGKTADKQDFYAVLDRVNENQAIHVDLPLPGEVLNYNQKFSRRYPVTDKSFDGTTDSMNRDTGN